RPTAKDLSYSVTRVLKAALMSPEKAYNEALSIAEENENACKKIGDYGNQIIENGFKIVTHCNAGWLAFVDYGSALSPIYTAKNAGKNIFVWVNETRPRLQGAKLTAWELKNENINHTIIPDNACAALMQKGEIHLMITGADRIANNGDTANKIGTLEKAIACKYFGIPFYVAAPLSTFDFEISSGNDIIIEERDEAEIIYAEGITQDNKLTKIQLCSPDSKAYNMAFDVTPAKLITGFITEKGIFTPQEIKLLCN
ncbi:MAG TPA: S-methyl-5-thioribose-1-phosphate isomerase, partial [Bacteroidales bacterium]|nr:S-methyl-5-thioribose-1-phosphate isomerase [Bacteroidales bacterium]